MYKLSAIKLIERLRHLYLRRIVQNDPNNVFDPLDEEGVVEQLLAQDIKVEPYSLSWAMFTEYQCQHNGRFGRWNNNTEKQLEYFISEDLLNFSPHDIVIDVGSWYSTYPKLIREKYGCKVYAQDLAYPAGIQGQNIGGDASDLPLPDNSVSKIVLHCTYEHFEGTSDQRFIKEVSRVLVPGGKMIIVPMYIHQKHTIWTDPSRLDSKRITLDEGARLYKHVGWNNRFGRHNSPGSLSERVVKNQGSLNFKVLHISNTSEMEPGCYVRFIGYFEKPS